MGRGTPPLPAFVGSEGGSARAFAAAAKSYASWLLSALDCAGASGVRVKAPAFSSMVLSLMPGVTRSFVSGWVPSMSQVVATASVFPAPPVPTMIADGWVVLGMLPIAC